MTAPANAPRGVWLGATKALHRPIPVSKPYPHLCGIQLPSGWRIRRIDCGACGDQQKAPITGDLRHHPHTTGCCPLPWQHQIHRTPEIDDDQRAAEARRTGEHDQ